MTGQIDASADGLVLREQDRTDDVSLLREQNAQSQTNQCIQVDFGDCIFDVPDLNFSSSVPQDGLNDLVSLEPGSWDLLDLGLFERMPQQDLIDHL